jgi:ABC-type antimicrobial peptide transport system permease subunit
VPFIIAFGVLALVISVLIVVNVVSGAVIAGITRIGVLKSLGFTPAQVVASYVLMVAVPGIFGCVAGVACGNLLAIPLLSQQAQVYQVGVLGVPFWVDVTVPLAVLAVTAAGAVLPALRAGRMSAVAAIATGRAPRPAHGYLVQRALARLTRLPRADHLSLPGVAIGVKVTAYGADPAWARLTLVAGQLYSGPDQVDVNTLFLTDTGTTVGSAYTLVSGSHHLTVTIAGEVFQPGNQPSMDMSAATLHAVDPAAQPSQYDASVKPGTSAQDYANTLSAALGRSFAVSVNGGSDLVGVVTLVTMLITVVAGLGVLNTVVLQIRERAHAIGVFKAVGMIPRQTLVMIVCSVAAVGLLAGIVAVPAGVYLHHGVLPVMTSAANSGTPPSLLSVYQPWELIVLALAGLVIAVAGALGPASWAARTRTVFALRAE